MPCWSSTAATVNLGKANLDLLTAALKDMGHNPRKVGNAIYFGDGYSFNQDTGELRIPRAEMATEIKQAYSAQIVKTQARKFGWNLKQTGPYQYEIAKR